MTESDGGVDLKKIDYLGRGVDGRTPPETWLDELDAYSSEKIRDLHPEGENFKADYQVHRRISESRSQLGLSVMRAKGKLGVNLHPALQLGAKLSAKRDTSKKLEKHKYHNITRRMTMIDDTSKDPGTITRNGKHYTKYECQLSQFILEHIEFLQRKANKESAADKYLGREITDLKGEDAVVKLEEYFGDVRERKKSESTQHLWQMVADACCSFMDEKKYTHYVYHIVLGASSQDSFDERESSIELSGGINAKGTDSVDVGMKGGFQKARKGNSVTKDTRGEVDSDGVVTNEEVIGVKLKPVSVLINRKSWELKVLIEGLLCCYDQKEKGDPLGPFFIHCVHENEPKLYWQVSNDEIHCTDEATKASKFNVHIKHGRKLFYIKHLDSEKIVAVQQSSTFDRTTTPLKLVLIPNPRETHLKLQHTTNKLVAVPQTTIAWEEKSPFFIKFCKSWGRSSRYVSVIKCGENTTTKDATEPHNQQSQTKEGANGNSQPKFKLASGTKHNSSDHKLVPLYFEPAVTSKLPEPVTFMGQAKGSPRSQLVCDYNSPLNEDKSKVFSFNECEPDSKSKVLPDDAEYESNSSPPYESRITSDSSLLSQEEDPSYAESDTVTDQEETYYDSEIEDAIFELVGDEYDFPLHI